MTVYAGSTRHRRLAGPEDRDSPEALRRRTQELYEEMRRHGISPTDPNAFGLLERARLLESGPPPRVQLDRDPFASDESRARAQALGLRPTASVLTEPLSSGGRSVPGMRWDGEKFVRDDPIDNRPALEKFLAWWSCKDASAPWWLPDSAARAACHTRNAAIVTAGVVGLVASIWLLRQLGD